MTRIQVSKPRCVVGCVVVIAALTSIVKAQAPCSTCAFYRSQIDEMLNQICELEDSIWNEGVTLSQQEDQLLDEQLVLVAFLQVPVSQRGYEWQVALGAATSNISQLHADIAETESTIADLESSIDNLDAAIIDLGQLIDACEICNPS